MPSDLKFASSPPAQTLDGARDALARQGWTLLAPSMLTDGVRHVLSAFGRIVPQYDGQEKWEVRARPGFERLPYSQSSNGIGAHTEVPTGDPPPHYLALHCIRQARCGGGHTLLADGLGFCASLDAAVARAVTRVVDFIATPTPGSTDRSLRSFALLSHDQGQPIFRFSDNLFRYGDVNPSERALTHPPLPIPHLLELAVQAERYFETHGQAVLVPDGAMLVWDNHRMMHARSKFSDPARHLTRYWLQ